MQEWIIAMLVISVLLILRDMAKTILTGRMCGSFSETCGYILWNAVQKGIPE